MVACAHSHYQIHDVSIEPLGSTAERNAITEHIVKLAELNGRFERVVYGQAVTIESYAITIDVFAHDSAIRICRNTPAPSDPDIPKVDKNTAFTVFVDMNMKESVSVDHRAVTKIAHALMHLSVVQFERITPKGLEFFFLAILPYVFPVRLGKA